MDSTLGQRIGNQVRQLRKKAGLSQAALAERMRPGVEPETVGRLERAERSPSLPRLASVAEALGTDLDSLLAGALHPDVTVRGSEELEAVVALLHGRSPDEVAGAAKVLEAHLQALDAIR